MSASANLVFVVQLLDYLLLVYRIRNILLTFRGFKCHCRIFTLNLFEINYFHKTLKEKMGPQENVCI